MENSIDNIVVIENKFGNCVRIYDNRGYRFDLLISDISELYFHKSKFLKKYINCWPGYFKTEGEFIRTVRKFRKQIKYIKTENWGMTTEIFLKNGNLHRLFGAAILDKYGNNTTNEHFYIEGEYLTKEDFEKMPVIRRIQRRLKIERMRNKTKEKIDSS